MERCQLQLRFLLKLFGILLVGMYSISTCNIVHLQCSRNAAVLRVYHFLLQMETIAFDSVRPWQGNNKCETHSMAAPHFREATVLTLRLRNRS